MTDLCAFTSDEHCKRIANVKRGSTKITFIRCDHLHNRIQFRRGSIHHVKAWEFLDML